MNLMRTSNIQHPTSNAQLSGGEVSHQGSVLFITFWMFDVDPLGSQEFSAMGGSTT
jgi:hypothetical protein